MVKLRGPALAKQAAGSIAGGLTFSNWKGKPYLKQHRKPKQPKTTPQVSMRVMLSFLATDWSNLSPANQATWDQLADQTKISPFNAFQSENLNRWRRNRAPTQTYPATETSPTASALWIGATGGVRQIRLQPFIYAPVNANWTGLIFHNRGGYPPIRWDYCVHVLRLDAVAAYYWTHTPLATGIHYYRLALGSDDGNHDWTSYYSVWAPVT